MKSDAEISAVRAYCNRVNPTIPGGCRCSYPKCYHEACAAEIQGGLKEARKAVPANGN